MWTKAIFKSKMLELSAECITCYNNCKEAYGCDFESIMADCCIDIVNLQYRNTDPLSFGMATLILLDGCKDEDADDRQLLALGIKAAFCWHAFESSEIERALKELKI